MSEENDEPWSAAEIEEWEHDRWLKIQEMGDDFYKNEEDNDEMKEDPYEEEERRRWQEEEERAKEAYFQEIKKEEERGVYRQTVAELIEKRRQRQRSQPGSASTTSRLPNLPTDRLSGRQ